MNNVSDPNVIHMFGVTDDPVPRIVLEFLPHGDLKAWLDTQHERGQRVETLGVSVLLHFGAQIARCVDMLPLGSRVWNEPQLLSTASTPSRPDLTPPGAADVPLLSS